MLAAFRGSPASLPTSSLGYDSLSYEAVPRLPYCTCTAGPRIRCSGGSCQSREMPRAAPGDTCPQSADTRASQRSRSGGGQQQQQRPEQQQKSREVARGGWEQHDGLEELAGSVSREVGGLGSQGQALAHFGSQFKGPASEAPPHPAPWKALPPGPWSRQRPTRSSV